MAIAKQGIMGPFRGKIGPIVGYELNGQHVMRSVGRRTRPFTQLELLNQTKMKVVSEFLSKIKPFVKFGFQREAPKGSRVGAFQLAQSYVRKHAIAFDDEGKPFVDPTKVLISRGDLEPPLNCTLTHEEGRVTLRWDVAQQGWGGDRIFVLLYDGNLFRFFREGGAERREQRDIFEVSLLQSIKQPVHVYAAFLSALADQVSNSVYCGSIPPSESSAPGIDRGRPQTKSAPPNPPNDQLGLVFPDQ